MAECFPALYTTEASHVANVSAARAESERQHKAACELQLASPLLTLPRELRDKIWEECLNGNIIHVAPSGERKGEKEEWGYHLCRSEKGLESSACPAGMGDHGMCETGGENTFVNLRRVCRQMFLEMRGWEDGMDGGFWRENAVQFSSLRDAGRWLFGIHEERRRRLGRVRIALPAGGRWGGDAEGDEDEMQDGEGRIGKWEAICNYFSNPWDRTSVSTQSVAHQILWCMVRTTLRR